MNCNPTLTAGEFKTVHNALCEIRSIQEIMTGVVNPSITDRLNAAIKDMEQGLMGAYAQDNESFETKSKHYSEVADELGLRAVWSIYEVDNLSDRHPYFGAVKLHYKDHWGKPVTKDIVGATWAALYVAGNAAIRDSGDDHHIFIEDFKPSKEDSSVLIMQTGS